MLKIGISLLTKIIHPHAKWKLQILKSTMLYYLIILITSSIQLLKYHQLDHDDFSSY